MRSSAPISDSNLSLSLEVSNESSNLSGIQVDNEKISHHNLFSAIALKIIEILIILLTLYVIVLNCRSNAANNMEPLNPSGRHPPASQCMTSSYISTNLELNPLSTENNLRSPKRSPYCDTNVFSLSNSSEMLQTATLTAGQDQVGLFYTLKYFLAF